MDNSEEANQHNLLLKRLARNLRWFMREKDVNSVELKKQLGISTGTISKIINDNYPDYNPRVITLHAIANYLGITMDDLFKAHAEIEDNEIGLQNCAPLVSYQG